ncbi:MAG: hypothetical protein ACRDMH_12320 [Solirubrobacterales bacterium]
MASSRHERGEIEFRQKGAKTLPEKMAFLRIQKVHFHGQADKVLRGRARPQGGGVIAGRA